MDTTDLRGLRASIYTDGRGNCSNGGISSRCQDVVIVGARHDRGPVMPLPRLSRVSAPVPYSAGSPEVPAVVVVYRTGINWRTVHIEPLDSPGDGTPWVAGGAYVGTSDSRFGDLVGFYGAVALHDRTETWKQYAALSSD